MDKLVAGKFGGRGYSFALLMDCGIKKDKAE
jgi:hypothetical protein